MKIICLIMGLFLSAGSWAEVFKCADSTGHIHYQSQPCKEEHKALQLNPKTGSSLDLNEQERQKAINAEQRKQQELQRLAEENAKMEVASQIKEQARAESKLTQTMVKQNPLQFSAYAIPAYDPDKLPDYVKPFGDKLPDIEKYRRLAAQKALATGKCQRVESDELTNRSKPDALIFLINCSSGANLYFNQTELN